MSATLVDPLVARLTHVRLSAALVLAGLLLNAGIVVLLVATVTGSMVVSLGALAIVGAVIVVLALVADTFFVGATGARPLRQGELPWLRPLVEELAIDARISCPEVLVADQEHLNAYTVGTGPRAKVVFFSGLLEHLSRDEVRAVAAHELGHVVNRDTSLAVWTWAIFRWVLVVKIGAVAASLFIYHFSKGLFSAFDDMGPLGAIFGIVLGAMGLAFAAFIWAAANAWAFLAELMQLALFRQREFLADATGSAICGRPDALSSALIAISDGPPMDRGSGTVAALCIASPVIASRWWDDLVSTHPATESRIAELGKLPTGKREFPEDGGQGLGSFSLLLPAGTIVLIAVLALCVPLLTRGSSSHKGSSGPTNSYLGSQQPASRNLSPSQSPSNPAAVGSPSPRSNALGRAATPKPQPSPTSSGPPASAIAYGQDVHGVITAGQVEDWRFEGQTGDIVTIRMTNQGNASLCLEVLLLDPTGSTVRSGSGSNPETRIQNVTLRSSGTYTIRASGCGGSTGGYQLDLLVKPPPGAIAYGRSSNGSIDISNDYQDWSFTGQAGDIVTIRMTNEGNASLCLEVLLLDQTGSTVRSGSGSNPETRIQNVTLRSSGTYTIRASGCSGSTGSYSLSLTRG